MNPFIFIIICLFMCSFVYEAAHFHWLKAAFFFLSAVINLTVVYL